MKKTNENDIYFIIKTEYFIYKIYIKDIISVVKHLDGMNICLNNGSEYKIKLTTGTTTGTQVKFNYQKSFILSDYRVEKKFFDKLCELISK